MYGPLGRHSYNWAERTVVSALRKDKFLRGSSPAFSFRFGMSRRAQDVAPVVLIPPTPAAERYAARAAKAGAAEAATQPRAAPKATPKRRATPLAPPPRTPVGSPPLSPPLSVQPPGISPGALGRSVAAAIAPLLAASAKKVKHKAAPGDLAPPQWVGDLDIASNPDRLTEFTAARTKYLAVCSLSEFIPTPISKAFLPVLVPTLRRWLKMPPGTALCEDWVVLDPSLDGQILPMLKSKFRCITPASLRVTLKALRIRGFSASWPDLNRAFDDFTAKWTVAVFEAQRLGVSLPTTDLADIMKSACGEVTALRDTIDGRQDDVVALEALVHAFLEEQELVSFQPGRAQFQRPPVDSRRPSSVSFAASPASVPPARSPAVPVPPSQSPSKPKAAVKLLAVAAEVMAGVCNNCGLPGHQHNDCVTAELFPAIGRGSSGVWRKGEREVWARSLPPETTAAIVAGVRKRVAAKKAGAAKFPARASPRSASSDKVNASRFPSFEARARVGSAGAACTPALADTGTPPNFVSAELAQAIVQAGTGTRVPAHVRISAAGVFRGECREALRTQIWFKARNVWTAHTVDLLIFETGQPVIIGYQSMVEWGWISLDSVLARWKADSPLRSQLSGWLHGLHAAGVRGSVKLVALEVLAAPVSIVQAAAPAPAVAAVVVDPALSAVSHRRWHAPRPPRVAAPRTQVTNTRLGPVTKVLLSCQHGT